MNKCPNFSASDTLDPPPFAWDSGNGALAMCELLVKVDDREPALAAADALVRSAELCGPKTTVLPSSPVIVEEPWQRAERVQDLFYNGVQAVSAVASI